MSRNAVHGAAAALRQTERLHDVLGERHRWHAVRAYLHKLGVTCRLQDSPIARSCAMLRRRRDRGVALDV